MKIVLDTNILIAIIGRRSPYRWVFDRLIDGKLSLCISNEILHEYREILARKTSVEVSENIANFLVINPHTFHSPIYFNFNLLSDPDDNKFVDCAVASDAMCIVSNDKHFQQLKKIDFPRVSILTIVEFETHYRHELERR